MALGLAGGSVSRCSRLPSLDGRAVSTALTDTADTRLGRAIHPRLAEHPGISGIHPLADARDAFAARVLLAMAAERSLDVQYYIWHDDLSGRLLFDALRAAADRGVRVRLLLDDNNTAGLDATLAALDAHPKIEVRLFNPFVIRKPRLLGYLTDFFRLNRRMHNKSFTVDNQATIIGGRNVGDEYFGASDGMMFADLDVMAAGPVVSEVSSDFDRYWASESSYPADRLLPPATPAEIDSLASAAKRTERDPAAVAYMTAIRESRFTWDLLSGGLPLEWATAKMISDDPAKGLGQAAPEVLLPQKLKEIIGHAQSELDLISPYFVPTAAGADALAALAAQGIRIRVLTNSLHATDVAAVHAGYAKRRKSLLEAGIALYELRRLSPGLTRRSFRSGSGSSGSSLHAKTFAVDRSRVFIGSFNFDPRSAKLNTEMGFVIESPAMAQRIDETFRARVPASAYEVRLSDCGKTYWIERDGGTAIEHTTEPESGFWQRAGVKVLSVLPIEWLL